MTSQPSQQLFNTSTSPELGPGPRTGIATASQIDGLVAQLPNLAEPQRELVCALALLWHDHHEPSHAIVQDLETRDGSYIHAILHRREPDSFNAKYWFRRVGQHPCFEALAVHAAAILENRKLESLTKKLVPSGQWDAFAFVDACEAAASPAAPHHEDLREIQRAEFEILLDYLSR